MLGLLVACADARADVVVIQVSPRMAALGADLRVGDVLANTGDSSLTHERFRQMEWNGAQAGPLPLRRRRSGQWQSVEMPAGEWAVDVIDPHVDAASGLGNALTSDATLQTSFLQDRWNAAQSADPEAATPWAIALLRRWAQEGDIARIRTTLPTVFETATDIERIALLYAVQSGLGGQELLDWAQRMDGTSASSVPSAAINTLRVIAYAQLRDLVNAESSATDLFKAEQDNLWGARAALALALNAFRQRQPEQAEQWLTEAERLCARIAPKGIDAANVLVFRGILDDRLGRADGMAKLEQGLQRLRELDRHSAAHGRAAFNAHFIALSQTPRNLVLAERYAREALGVLGQVAPATNLHAQARAALADVLWRQLQLTEAEQLFAQSWHASRRLDPQSYETLSTRLQLAQVWQAQGRIDEAISASREIEAVLDALPEAHPVRRTSLRQDLLRFRAGWYLDAGDGAAAYADLVLALQGSAPPVRADLQLLLADAERLRGNWSEAQAHLDALRAQHPAAEISRLDGVEIALTQARLQRDQGQWDVALASYREAIALLGTAREKAASREDLRARWASRFQALYKEPLAMVMSRDNVAEVATLEAQYRWQAARALLGDGPASAALPWPTAPPQATALEKDQVLLSLVVMPDRTALLVYGADQALPSVFQLPVGQEQWRERIRRWRTLLGAPDVPAAAHAAQRQGHALFRDLFGQLPAEIRARSRWVIVPDADLHDLPWAALVVNDSPEPVYLIERASIALASSVDSFNLLSERRNSGRHAVGAGDAIDVPARQGDAEQRRQAAAPLDAARDEVLALREVFGPDTRIALGRQASEAWLREQARTARWLHVAVHGLLDRENPLRSHLLLASGSGVSDDDGQISAEEVMTAWSLPGSVVTLSACESALGQAFGGDGLQGLVQALQWAGAKTVFGTLWAVDDSSTGWLMRDLQPRIAAGSALDVALADTQRSWLQQAREAEDSWWHDALATLGLAARLPIAASEPYFWAGLSVHGATGSEPSR